MSIDIARRGLRVALVSNGFFDATKLLDAVGRSLADHLPGVQVRLYERRDPSVMAEAKVIDEIITNNDVAITALGHCGSCTSSATRDAVNIARAGRPACALISEKFIEASGFVARSVGMPAIPRVSLPHPVAGAGSERIEAIARAAVPQIIAMWAGNHVLAA
jgi:hypothetical protein